MATVNTKGISVRLPQTTEIVTQYTFPAISSGSAVIVPIVVPTESVTPAGTTGTINTIPITVPAIDVSSLSVGVPSITTPLVLDPKLFISAIELLSDNHDYVAIGIDKSFNEPSVNTQEVFSTLILYTRTFTDPIHASDDTFGEANIDDDQTAFVQKSLSTSYAASDTPILVTIYNRDYSELINSSEVYALLVNKDILNVSTAIELHVFRINKGLVDQTDLQESAILSTNKAITELADVADSKAVYLDKEAIKSRAFPEDSLSTLAEFNRALLDVVQATDDIFGEANIDDDQVAIFGKSLTDSTSGAVDSFNSIVQFRKLTNNYTHTTDSMALAPKKVFTETLHPIVTFEKFDVIKSLSEDPLVLDAAIISVGTSISDITTGASEFIKLERSTALEQQLIYTSDTELNFVLEKSLTDLIFATDDAFADTTIDDDQVAFVNKALIDSFILTDADNYYQVVDFNRDISEATTFSEMHVVEIEKAVEDAAVTQDFIERFGIVKLLADSASILEVKELTLNKPLEDSVSAVVDYYVNNIQPEKQETVLTTETRTAHVQNYVEPYYVELDYVGTDLTL